MYKLSSLEINTSSHIGNIHKKGLSWNDYYRRIDPKTSLLLYSYFLLKNFYYQNHYKLTH